jgi:crotonobetainyl-CoA:carnitine CoA-transferase CaiB-like acyl-CoA transferase
VERTTWFTEVVGVITEWTLAQPRKVLHELLDEHDIPNEPVRTLSEVWDDVQLEARGFYLEYPYGALGDIRTFGSPIHLSRAPMELRHVPPAAGAHNEEVLREVLGYDDSQVAPLYETGALWGASE